MSCSKDKLTNEMAFEILSQDYDYQCYDWLVSFSDRFSGNVWEEINKKSIIPESYKILEKLQNEGYIHSLKNKNNARLIFNLTEKGEAFRKNRKSNFIVANAKLLEITGISENTENGTAIVRYKYKWEPEAFYELRKNKDNCSTSPAEDEVEFVKYDTGWKVKK